MSNFANKMYLYRYFNALEADVVALGYPLCGSHDIAVIFLNKKDFVAIEEGHFEKLSPACVEYMRTVLKSKKSDIHYRFTFGAKDLQWLSRGTGNPDLKCVCTKERFDEIIAEIRQYVHQNNKGYAFEYVVYEMFGLEWNWKHKGVDLKGVEFNGQTVNIEIKFFNGQAKK